jgi:hypothetical protein
VRLIGENLLGVKAFDYAPGKERLIKVGGKNGAGKSGALDLIVLAMEERNRKLRPKAVRIGAKKGKVVFDLGDLIVTRTITAAGGGTLDITREDGSKITESPQAVLDALYGKLAFDPGEFLRMDAAKQVATLKQLVGLDFSEMDAERDRAYQERTLVGRDVLSTRTRLEAMEFIPNPPTEEVDTRELATRLTEASGRAARAQGVRAEYDKQVGRNAEIVQQIERLRYELEQGEERAEVLADQLRGTGKIAEEIRQITEQMAGAQEHNAKVRTARERNKLQAELEDLENTQGILTEQIGRIDSDKRAKLAQTKFPVDGLGFDDTGVTYQGVPFVQASAAQRLRVSVGIGMALNPNIRVILIRDASLLDEDSQELILQLAEEYDYQVWMECVTSDPRKCSVFIQEGEIVTPKEWDAEQEKAAQEAARTAEGDQGK